MRFTSVVSVVAVLIVLALLLYPVSFFSGGFVLIAGFLAERFNSAALATLIFVLAFIALLIASVVFLVRDRGRIVVEDFEAYDRYGYRRYRVRRVVRAYRRGLLLLTLAIVLAVAGAFFNAAVVTPSSGRYIAENFVESIGEPIDVYMTRLIPQETAYAYATSFLALPTHRIYIDESYEYYADGSVIYNWIVEPSGFWNELLRNAYGVVLVNGSSYPPQVVFVNRSLHWSLHRVRLTPLYVDSLLRQLKLSELPVQPLLDDNVEVYVEERVYILVPLKTWVKGLTYSIPALYGYAVIDEGGGVTVVRAEELLSHQLTGRIFRSLGVRLSLEGHSVRFKVVWGRLYGLPPRPQGSRNPCGFMGGCRAQRNRAPI